MNEKAPEEKLDTLNAGIAKSREEIAALAATLNKLAEKKAGESIVDGKHPHDEPTNGDQQQSGWTGFRHRLDDAEARGESIAKGLAEEIRRHPLIGGTAAFGLGFLFARLLFKRRKKASTQ
jgi:hypothetical protein